MIQRFLSDEAGATALEYAVIAGLLSIVIMASIAPIGDKLKVVFGLAEAGFGP